MPRYNSARSKSAKILLLGTASVAMMAVSQVSLAQDSAEDEVVATGTRQLIQDAITLKRDSTTVVDGLSADEIGELPGLSIAEALETITAVGSQREGSGATEVSIRGLGPFLGSTVINGREATNGGGDRSVNFSQFPSELFNKIEVHKTQSASLIEGGVAGQIALSTLKPLEYGKRRIQLQAKGNIQPDNLRIEDPERTVGYRLTGSYVDQWESNTLGEFGISIGGQLQRRPNAEQEARSSSTFDACRVQSLDGNSCDDGETDVLTLDPNSPLSFEEQVDGFFDSNQRQSAQTINPLTGQPIGLGQPIVLTTSGRSFRQNVTDDSRDAIFGAAQWRPNDRVDINIDAQYSDRSFLEFRNEIEFESNDIEVDAGDVIDGFALQAASDGSLRVATTSGQVQARTQFNERSEEYFGVGGSVSFDATDRLNLFVDGAYSDTSRREEQIRGRVATGSRDIGIEILQNGGQAQQFTLVNTNVNDASIFTDDSVEVQEDLNQFRNHQIWSLKGDAEYTIDNGLFSSFKAGARYSNQQYDQLPRVRNEVEIDDNTDFLDGAFASSINGVDVVSTIELDIGTGDERDLANLLGLGALVGFGELGNGNDLNNDAFEGISGVVPGSTATFVIDNNGDIDVTTTAAEFVRLGFANDGDTDTPNDGFTNLGTLAAAACQRDSFVEPGFLNGEVNGNLITNIDSDGNVIAAGTGNEFITFNGLCLAETLVGRSLAAPGADQASGAELVQSVDIEEETYAFYGQLDFDTEFEGLPVRGNFGVRYVDTTLVSNSFRENLTVDVDDDGNVTGLSDSLDLDGLVSVRDEFSYSEFLPSFNIVAEINDDVLVRGGIFRALSRPDPSDLGNGRTFNITSVDNPEEVVSLGDFVGSVVASGNPNLEPFTSWNYDLAAEWYPNEDSILAVGAYYKVFTGGFQNSLQAETFTVNDESFTINVPVLTTSDETNTIFGVEATASHAFTYLPGIWSGLGFKASYNFADSDFEFEDGRLGEAVTFDADGNVDSVRQGFIPPANLVGLSKHTANGQIYFNVGKATFTGIGKYRSSFFQQFITTPLNLRFIDEAFVADARISYKVNDHIKLSLEGSNILNTAREQFNPTLDSFAEINVFGPRYFAGITAKF